MLHQVPDARRRPPGRPRARCRKPPHGPQRACLRRDPQAVRRGWRGDHRVVTRGGADWLGAHRVDGVVERLRRIHETHRPAPSSMRANEANKNLGGASGARGFDAAPVCRGSDRCRHEPVGPGRTQVSTTDSQTYGVREPHRRPHRSHHCVAVRSCPRGRPILHITCPRGLGAGAWAVRRPRASPTIRAVTGEMGHHAGRCRDASPPRRSFVPVARAAARSLSISSLLATDASSPAS